LDLETKQQLKSLVEEKAFNLAAMKVEKMSGDLRTVFTIVQNAIGNRVKEASDNNDSQVVVSMDDVNKVLLEMYSSKTFRIIKQLPRSHSMVLRILEDYFRFSQLAHITEEELLKQYNSKAS